MCAYRRVKPGDDGREYGAFVLIEHAPAFSRRQTPEVWPSFCPSKDRGRRESRVPDAPAASRAKFK
jgi:hypothetical protein